MNSIEISGQSNSVSESNSFAFKEKDSTPASGPGFGQVFSSMAARDKTEATGEGPGDAAQAQASGQDLAETVTDPTAAQPQLDASTQATAADLIGGSALQGIWLNGQNPLKAVTLGPGMNAITPGTAAPDMASLADFARAQGLDEHAVRWLFQGAQGGLQGKTDAQTLSTPNGSDAGLLQGMQGLMLTAQASATASSAGTGKATALVLTGTGSPMAMGTAGASMTEASPALAVSAQATALGASDEALDTPDVQTPKDGTQGQTSVADAAPAALMLGAVAGLEQAMSRPQAPTPAPSEMARAEPTESLMVNLRMVAPPLWMQRANGAAPSSGSPDGAAKTGDDVQSSLDAIASSPSDASQDVHTVDLDLSDILRDLRTPTGPSTVVMLAALNQGRADADPAPSSSSEDADLKIDGTDLMVRPLEAQAAKTATSETLAPRAPVANTNPAARVEQLQQQADKMGQVIGQRMLSEIEKGHWEMKMMLRPATLGHIEVQMTLRGGELDASFHAPQAMTRELLQDGLSRLRETLTQAGMDVANIHVGDNSSQKRGGESTPGQAQTPAQSGSSDKQEQAQDTVSTRPMTRSTSEGWDVMV
jgi:flagellar hook-length control protein FliK